MDTISIQVLDLGICNLTSMLNGLNRIGVRYETIKTADRVGQGTSAIILPGVGAYSAGMEVLNASGIGQKVRDLAAEGRTPILGVCLGMQLLFEGSDEFGHHEGLGLLPGWVKQLQPVDESFRVPNIGWCDVQWTNPTAALTNTSGTASYYFVHSFWCDCKKPEHVAGVVDMGFPMTAAVQSGPVMGVQFHPEKSLDSGLDLLSRFAQFAKDFTQKNVSQ